MYFFSAIFQKNVPNFDFDTPPLNANYPSLQKGESKAFLRGMSMRWGGWRGSHVTRYFYYPCKLKTSYTINRNILPLAKR